MTLGAEGRDQGHQGRSALLKYHGERSVHICDKAQLKKHVFNSSLVFYNIRHVFRCLVWNRIHSMHQVLMNSLRKMLTVCLIVTIFLWLGCIRGEETQVILWEQRTCCWYDYINSMSRQEKERWRFQLLSLIFSYYIFYTESSQEISCSTYYISKFSSKMYNFAGFQLIMQMMCN